MENLEFKGTQGEWKLDSTYLAGNEASWMEVCDAKGNQIAQVKGTHCNIPDEECIANAKLFSASRDLLEACQSFLELFRESDMRPEDECYEIADKMEFAIKKALE